MADGKLELAGYIENGEIKFCKDNPNSPSCQEPEGFSDGFSEGVTACETNPSDYGLFDQTALETAKAAGKMECKANPAECLVSIDDGADSAYCKEGERKNQNCASIPDGKLYLPVVDYYFYSKNEETDEFILDENGELILDEGTIRGAEMDIFLGGSGSPPPIYFELTGISQEETKALTIDEIKGEGKVISYPMGIKCDNSDKTDCTEEFEQGASIELFAVPTDSNSTFTGWSGNTACEGITTNHLKLTLADNTNCKATFEEVPVVEPPTETHTLTVALSPNDGTLGSVTIKPEEEEEINCNSDCSEDFKSGETVTLTATANDDSSFTGWSGDDARCEGTNPLILTLEDNITCTATFEEVAEVPVVEPPTVSTHTLTVALLPEGESLGTVTSDPEGIDCGDTCSEDFESGEVILTATPNGDSSFTGWSGDAGCKDTTNPLVLTLENDITCKATFEEVPVVEPPTETHTLTVALSPNDGTLGTVISDSVLEGIDCGETCKEGEDICGETCSLFNSGENVTLTAMPNEGSTFTGWTGCADDSSELEITVTMDSVQKCTATFETTTHTLTVSTQGVTMGVSGRIKFSPEVSSELGCKLPQGKDIQSEECTRGYDVGTQVQLKLVLPNPGKFDRWECDGESVELETASNSGTNITLDTGPSPQTNITIVSVDHDISCVAIFK